MKRAEMDEIEGPSPTVGTAESMAADDDHLPHSYLYIPDLSSQTRWSAHRVPERQERPVGRREMGFRR